MAVVYGLKLWIEGSVVVDVVANDECPVRIGDGWAVAVSPAR